MTNIHQQLRDNAQELGLEPKVVSLELALSLVPNEIEQQLAAQTLAIAINHIVATTPTELIVNDKEAAMELSQLYMDAYGNKGAVTGPFLMNEKQVWHVQK